MNINSGYIPGERTQRGDELRVGYVPLMDAAPVIMAQEKGFFAAYGLNVKLERELGWAAVRDKIVFGQLHAAHALAGMVWSTTLGIRCQQRDCATGLIINAHGNAITLSKELYRSGVRDAKSFAVRVRTDRKIKRYTLAVVAGVSTHYYLMKKWLESAGLDITKDVRIVTIPPSLMASNLEEGNIDGFCVGEPWNTVSVEKSGGVVVATSRDIDRYHTEKVLMASAEFIHEREADYIALAAAVLEGCKYCYARENHQEVAEVIARRQYLNTEASLLERSLSGQLACAKGDEVSASQELHLFYGGDVNLPTGSKARRVWAQIEQTAVYPFLPAKEINALAEGLFLKSLFEKVEARVASQKRKPKSIQAAPVH
ncbi:MAG: CmpA/NrtA family ABC transporter substrate-binding protein [Verrucomicrobiota bacterium]